MQVTDSSTTANFTLAGNDLGLSAVGLSRANGAAADNTTVSLGLTGAGGIVTSAGSGRLTLTGASSYGGGTNVNVGQVNVQNGSAFGTGRWSVAGGAVLELQNNITVAGVPLTLSPSSPDGILRSISGDNVWTGRSTRCSAATSTSMRAA